MELTDFNQVFKKISSGKAMKIALPLKDSPEKRRIACVYEEDSPPAFKLLFTSGSLPIDNLDRNRKAAVLIDIAGQNVTLSADIESVIDDQTLLLRARDVITHEQMRDYFRVDVSAPLIARPVLPGTTLADDQEVLNGETVDVSGGGILAVFPHLIPADRPVRVELILPSSDEPRLVEAIAHVVRTQKLKDNQYKIALRFDQISPEDRDRIMACCFEIQRKHLRLKVQVKQP